MSNVKVMTIRRNISWPASVEREAVALAAARGTTVSGMLAEMVMTAAGRRVPLTGSMLGMRLGRGTRAVVKKALNRASK